jgi:hypothetical protein
MREMIGAGLLLMAAALPLGWKARLDDPAAKIDAVTVSAEKDALTFKTYSVAGIYYKPADKTAKNYEVSAAFSQLKPSEHAEGYGLFISGQDLDKDTQRYLYFLIRQDGKVSIRTRNGAATKPVVDWREAAPMKEPKGIKTSNTLLIRTAGDGVLFFIDDKQVYRMPRSQVGEDGVAGLRINHNLEVQVSKFTVKKLP